LAGVVDSDLVDSLDEDDDVDDFSDFSDELLELDEPASAAEFLPRLSVR
jgi:hypothetical protein